MKNRDYFLPVVLFVSVLIGALAASYGMPYTMHPDESYLVKHPLKCLANFSQFEFVSPMSAYDWLVAAWYGMMFLFGLLSGSWSNFSQFQDLVIMEAGIITLLGRFLSVLLVSAAHYYMYKLLKKVISGRFALRAVFLLLVFNPILLVSAYWVKYEPIGYLSTAVILNYFYRYFAEGTVKRATLYALCIVALSVRIELACFFVAAVIADYIKRGNERKPFFEAALVKAVILGIVVFSLITLYPLHAAYKLLGDGYEAVPLSSDRTFTGVIVAGITKQLLSAVFYKGLLYGLIYYIKLAIVALGLIPVVAMVPIARRLVARSLKNYSHFKLVLYLYGLGFLTFIVIFPNRTTHYFLNISFMLIVLFAYALKQVPARLLKPLLVFSLFFSGSLSISFLYTVSSVTDPRLEARKFLLGITNKEDLLAIETISVNGYNPFIEELPGDLRQKAYLVKKHRLGTGRYYEMKARLDSADSRKILDIFSEDYFAGTAGEGIWINAYDIAGFVARAPKYYITTWPIGEYKGEGRREAFYTHVLQRYKLLKAFEFDPADKRLKFLVSTEPYFKSVYVYVKG